MPADLTKRLQTYIQQNFAEKLTLQSIAQAHGISATKLKRIFREEMGNSVMAYVTHVRIKAANRNDTDRVFPFDPKRINEPLQTLVCSGFLDSRTSPGRWFYERLP